METNEDSTHIGVIEESPYVGVMAKVTPEGLEMLGALIHGPLADVFSRVMPISKATRNSTGNGRNKVRIHGLWFDLDKVILYPIEDYPEYYL